jgi:hypothetical protein
MIIKRGTKATHARGHRSYLGKLKKRRPPERREESIAVI